MDAKQKMTKARAGLILDAPFFGSLALKLKLTPDPDAPTAWTDGHSIGYNPNFIDGLSLDETKGLLAHEVMHIAAGHHVRRQNRDPKKWNIAGDHAINGLLSKFTLPAGGLPGVNQSAEAIYNSLPDPDPNGGADGGGSGEIRDAPGKDGQKASPAELAQAEAEIKISVAQAAQQAAGSGRLPAELKKFVSELLNPVIDWREVLRRFIDTNAKNDYSWTPPNRRFIHAGLYLPGLQSQELGTIACLVDMSGSVSREQAAELASELMGISQAFQSKISVFYFNHKVTGTEVFEPGDVIEISVESGGGTSYRPPFEALETMDPSPAVIVCLTDGDCSRFPDNMPGAPVLWAITGGGADDFRPPFGDVIAIN